MKRFLALSMILGVTSFGSIGCGEPKTEEVKVEAPADAKPAEGAAPAAPADAPAAPADAPAAPAAPAEAPK